LLFFQVS